MSRKKKSSHANTSGREVEVVGGEEAQLRQTWRRDRRQCRSLTSKVQLRGKVNNTLIGS